MEKEYSLTGVYSGTAKVLLDYISQSNGQIPKSVKMIHMKYADELLRKAGKSERAEEIKQIARDLRKSLDSKV